MAATTHHSCFPLKVGLTMLQGVEPVEKAWFGKSAGRRVLVHGGSTSVGSLAVQYFKRVLQCHVTATCGPDSIDTVKGFGADECINYREQQFEDAIGAGQLDCVFDVLPYAYEQRTLASGILKSDGWYVRVTASDVKLKPGDPGTDPLRMFVPETRPWELMRTNWNAFARCVGVVGGRALFTSG